MTRKIIIGLDGVPYRLITDLAEKSVMPTFKRLAASGTLSVMRSSLPEVSSVAWSSIITGKNPGEHGVFGFTDIAPGSYRLTYPNFRTLRLDPYWVDRVNGKSIIVNVPSTYPVREMDGIHIAGFVALDFKKSVYPQSLIPDLENVDYRVDVDASRVRQSIPLFLQELDATLDARMAAARLLWDREDWKCFTLIFTGTDRLSHFLWDAYEDPNHEYHGSFLDHFRKIDSFVEELLAKMDDDDDLFFLSDHGFELTKQEVYLNKLLKDNGFLKWKQFPPRSTNDIVEGTAAFCLDPGRIYINDQRFPRPGVAEGKREEVVNELKDLLFGLAFEGEPVVREIFHRENIYSGPAAADGPDLVVLCQPGYSFRGGIAKDQLFDKELFTGKHTYDDAFFLARRKTELPDELTVSNVLDVMM
jgi:predicted AlkP superfamily phosphohydrolase/phosphomutase